VSSRTIALLVVGALVALVAVPTILNSVVPGGNGGELTKLAKRFGDSVHAGRVDEACAMLTPDSRASFEGAGGCAHSLPRRVNGKFEDVLTAGDFNCEVSTGDDGRVANIGTNGNSSCLTQLPVLRFKRINGKWLVVLAPRSVRVTGSQSAITSCVRRAGTDASKALACVGQH
jgi:hypothetical protein